MRVARVFARVLIVVLTLLVGASAAVVVASQTAWFRNWLRGYIVAEAHQYLNGELAIGQLNGDLFHGISLERVAVTMDGQPVAGADEISLDYNLLHIITSGVSVDELRLTRPVLHLRRDDDGWRIARLLKRQEQEADRQGPEYPITIESIVLQDAAVTIEDNAQEPAAGLPQRIDDLDASLNFRYEPVRYSLDISSLSLRTSDPAITVTTLTGGVAVKDDTLFLDNLALRTANSGLFVDGAVEHYLTAPSLELRAASDTLTLQELAPFVPALASVALTPSFSLSASGPLDRLSIDASVQSGAGNGSARVVADLLAPGQAVSGEIAVQRLNLAAITNDPSQQTDITAQARLDLGADSFNDRDSLHGTIGLSSTGARGMGYTLDRIRADATVKGREVTLDAAARAYGVDATANGRVVLPEKDEPLRYDLKGRAAHLNIERLPRSLNAPAVATDITAVYQAAGAQPLSGGSPRVDATLTFEPSTVPGARLEGGSTAAVHVRGHDVAYRADARVSDVNLQTIGEAFGQPALADPRYASVINGHVVAEGAGTSLETMRLDANGTLGETTIAGGRIPDLTFTASVADGAAHVTATGRVEDFDPSVLSGREEARGRVSGRLDVDATMQNVAAGVTPETIEASARVELDPSEVGGFEIRSGRLVADYHEQEGTVRELEITGPDLHITASGPFALNETGQSNLTFHADSPRLEEIGRILGQPISGLGRIDGTLTGNRSELHATGELEAGNLKYGDNGALTVNAKYNATIPEFAFDQARVDATTAATFVEVGGQEINEVNVNVSYGASEVQFNGVARQPQRSLTANGAVLLHPDHQEVHLQQLDLSASNQQWTLQPGSESTIKYGGGVIDIADTRLVSGDQTIAVSGQFGQPDDDLKVELTNVDLAGVDALLLRPPQFTGRLNASATVSGTREEPRVEGTFAVNGGGFRQFTYESLTGNVQYVRDGIDLDARLQQNASQWITAKGHLPAALFSSAAAGDAAPTPRTSAADQIDLTIDSSPLGLGLVQGFTTALTDVRGTVEAHMRVEGTADDPRPSGAITIADGALTVQPTGVSYAYINGRVDFEGERIRIDQITVLDNHDAALSITGALQVRERTVGAGEIWVNADDFKIIDNELGNVRIQSAMKLYGQLRQPRIEGDLGITTGRINLDEIIALMGQGAYSTEQINYEDTGDEAAAGASPSGLDAVTMNVRVTVPNDLVVQAENLQTPGAPVSLGALDVTLGGDLTITKNPGGAPQLVGSVTTVRGTYDFQGRRFTIQRDGSIRFEGGEELNPRLDLRTTRTIQGVEARVNVRGTLRQPEIVLTSNPPLEEADILSLIVFNQPINQLGEGQQVSLAARAQSLAAGAVAGQLAQSIGNALDLDTFEINVAPEQGGAPELTIGQQVGQNLYLKVQQGIGDQSTTNVVIEYEITNWLRFQTNFMQGSQTQQSLFRRRTGSGADLIVLFEK